MPSQYHAYGPAYGERIMTYNSRLTQELGKWVDTQPGSEAIHDAFFRVYFVEARDISRPEMLLEIAASVGLPVEGACAVLDQRTFRDALDTDWALSRRYGITGVRTFVAGRHDLADAQPYEALGQLVREAASAEGSAG